MLTENFEGSPSIRDFVFQDAIERAFYIKIKGIKEYETEKKKIYEQKQYTVSDEYDRLKKGKLVEKRIHRSSLINRSRMQKMEARNNAIMKIVGSTQQRILKNIVSNEGMYKDLLKNLIVEGLIKLLETDVLIRCLKRDYKLVESLLPQCKKYYQELMKRELNRDLYVNISVSRNHNLVERTLQNSDDVSVYDYTIERGKYELIKKSDEDTKCFGGVILTTNDGLIICKNTLDARIDLAFNVTLPNIRSLLFSDAV